MTKKFFTSLFCCCFWIRDPGWVKNSIRDPQHWFLNSVNCFEDNLKSICTLEGSVLIVYCSSKLYASAVVFVRTMNNHFRALMGKQQNQFKQHCKVRL